MHPLKELHILLFGSTGRANHSKGSSKIMSATPIAALVSRVNEVPLFLNSPNHTQPYLSELEVPDETSFKVTRLVVIGPHMKLNITLSAFSHLLVGLYLLFR